MHTQIYIHICINIYIHTYTYIDAFEYLPEPNSRMLNKVFMAPKREVTYELKVRL